jgi:hypothetical protein
LALTDFQVLHTPIEVYQPKLFAENLTGKQAAKRIEDLKREIALANSF